MKIHPMDSVAANNASSRIDLRANHRIFILVLLVLARQKFCTGRIDGIRSELGHDACAGAPTTITLQDALQRARLNDPQYRSGGHGSRAWRARIESRRALECCPT